MESKDLVKRNLDIIYSLIGNHIKEYLNLCESEIEKIFVVHLFHYLFDLKFDLDREKKVGDIIYFEEFNAYTINSKDLNYSSYKAKERIDIDNTKYKVIGIKLIADKFFVSETYKGQIFGYDEFKEYVFIPQYIVTVEGSEFRLDIALLLTIFHDNKTYKVIKIAIECDGHEFHSSKEQIAKDSERTRKLMLNGWKVIRYSGSELYKKSNNYGMLGVFDEIIRITKQD